MIDLESTTPNYEKLLIQYGPKGFSIPAAYMVMVQRDFPYTILISLDMVQWDFPYPQLLIWLGYYLLLCLLMRVSWLLLCSLLIAVEGLVTL